MNIEMADTLQKLKREIGELPDDCKYQLAALLVSELSKNNTVKIN